MQARRKQSAPQRTGGARAREEDSAHEPPSKRARTLRCSPLPLLEAADSTLDHACVGSFLLAAAEDERELLLSDAPPPAELILEAEASRSTAAAAQAGRVELQGCLLLDVFGQQVFRAELQDPLAEPSLESLLASNASAVGLFGSLQRSDGSLRLLLFCQAPPAAAAANVDRSRCEMTLQAF